MENTAATPNEDDDFDTWWLRPYFKSIGAFGDVPLIVEIAQRALPVS